MKELPELFDLSYRVFMRTLPRSDLKLLKEQVLSQTPDAALPSRLSDFWLYCIARDLERTVGDEIADESDPTPYGAAPLALIMHLLSAKHGSPSLSISLEELREHFCRLRFEIGLEMVNRRTSYRAESATIDTILTDRKMMVYPSKH